VGSLTESIGFIGAGRMATALARGCVERGLVAPQQLLAADPSSEARDRFSRQVPGRQLFAESRVVLERAEIVFLAVKPQVMNQVLAEIRDDVQNSQLVVSIAAGVTLARLAAGLSSGSRLVRVMPNTPCLVGRGASCYSRGSFATKEDGEKVKQVLTSVGIAHEVEEELLDAVTGLSGSGPAFVYLMIESLMAGGVAQGLPQTLALELAAQTVRGAAEMVQTTGLSPEELREQVTSPGGTTLAGLETLEQLKVETAFKQAVEAAARRSQELGRADG